MDTYPFFQTYWLLLEDQLWTIHSFMKGLFFTEQLQSVILSRLLKLLQWHLASIYSFRGYIEQITFRSSCSFLGRATLGIPFFKDIFHHPNCSHPSFELGYLSQKEWQSSILWRIQYLFWREIFAVTHCLSNYFCSGMFISKK